MKQKSKSTEKNLNNKDSDRVIGTLLETMMQGSNIFAVRDMQVLINDIKSIISIENITIEETAFVLDSARLGDYGTVSTLSASHVRAWVREEKKRREKSNPFKNMAF